MFFSIDSPYLLFKLNLESLFVYSDPRLPRLPRLDLDSTLEIALRLSIDSTLGSRDSNTYWSRETSLETSRETSLETSRETSLETSLETSREASRVTSLTWSLETSEKSFLVSSIKLTPSLEFSISASYIYFLSHRFGSIDFYWL